MQGIWVFPAVMGQNFPCYIFRRYKLRAETQSVSFVQSDLMLIVEGSLSTARQGERWHPTKRSLSHSPQLFFSASYGSCSALTAELYVSAADFPPVAQCRLGVCLLTLKLDISRVFRFQTPLPRCERLQCRRLAVYQNVAGTGHDQWL